MSAQATWEEAAVDTVASWRDMVRGSVGSNVLAGVTVAFVALPLNLALAMACGLPPVAGVVTGVLAGVLAGMLGGARLQISGPEVALAPLTFEIVTRHGVSGLMVATFLAGIFQLLLGAARMGRFIHAIPRPVVGGFLAAVGLLVLDGQLPKLLGMDGVRQLSAVAPAQWLGHADAVSLALGAVVMGCFALLPKLDARIPGALVGLALVGGATALTGAHLPMVGTLQLSGLRLAFPDFTSVNLAALLPEAVALALLASIDSLLSAVSVDAVTRGPRHRPDQELVAQGLANMASSLLGGMPVAGAVVRSMAAVQAGATTRLASVVHAGALALLVLIAAPFVARLPLTALAGILLVVGVRLVRVGELATLWRLSRLEALAFVVTAVSIVVDDFVAGVITGLGVSLLHFAVQHSRPTLHRRELPHLPGVTVVEVHGPIFFASHAQLESLFQLAKERHLVLDLRGVPMVDVTGADALRSLVERLAARQLHVQVVGALPPVRQKLEAVGLNHALHGGRIYDDLAAALADAFPDTKPPTEQPSPGDAFRLSAVQSPPLHPIP